MSEQNPELSPDLEWMLQSGQLGDRALIPRLVQQEYTYVFRLAFSLLEDPLLARRAALRTLTQAVINAHQYQPDSGLRAWLYRLTLQVCREYQGTQNFTVHQTAHGDIPEISPEDIGRITGTSSVNRAIPETLPAELDHITAEIVNLVNKARRRKRLITLIQEAALIAIAILLVLSLGRAAASFIPPPTLQPTLLKTRIVMEVFHPTTTPPPTLTASPYPENAILFTAQPGDTLERIAGRINVEVEILQVLNNYLPGQALQPGQTVMIGIGEPPLSLVTPTPVTPVPPIEPLTVESSAEQIRQRILESRRNWHTLWADAQFILYGPPGYVGPPRITRYQAWISQPYYSLALSGGPDGEPKRVVLGVGGLARSLDLETGERSTYGGTGLVDYSVEIYALLVPNAYDTFEGAQEVIRSDNFAGREVLVVDWYSAGSALNQPFYMGRYWVDSITGVILRHQFFDPNEPGWLLNEFMITDIAFDLDIPNRLFDHYQPFPTQFASAQGDPLPPHATLPTPDWQSLPGRQPLPRSPAPVGFDPARSRLTFQWEDPFAINESEARMADLFAGDYYLGSVDLGDPFILRCVRSPNGQVIAFAETLDQPPYGNTPLHWVSLEDLNTVHNPLPGFNQGDFTFAPDNHRLALYGCRGLREGCSVYLLDIHTGELKQLLPVVYAHSFAWSPSGEYLAFLGALDETEEGVWVVDAQDGEIVYNGPMDWGKNLPAADSPTHSWGVPFPVWPGGLEACASPLVDR